MRKGKRASEMLARSGTCRGEGRGRQIAVLAARLDARGLEDRTARVRGGGRPWVGAAGAVMFGLGA